MEKANDILLKEHRHMDKKYCDADFIIRKSIEKMSPDKAVEAILEKKKFHGEIYVVAVGKAAWMMAKTCSRILGDHIRKGVVLTKYDHAKEGLPHFEIREAGHPVPDENSLKGTECILEMVHDLKKEDTVLFLLSGGGSALFEKPVEGVTLEDIQSVTKQCLKNGAGIKEINTIRKRLSEVKGGKFASYCFPASVCSIILSDVVGNEVDMIASGPTVEDRSTCQDAIKIVDQYQLKMRDSVYKALYQEPPKKLMESEVYITGSVSELCKSAADIASQLGYTPYILTDSMDGEAREVGRFLAAVARNLEQSGRDGFRKPCAIIAGGETIVHLTGNGKGGRNQEIALSAAMGMKGLKHSILFSISSDGTDGPTDAAGGIVDGNTISELEQLGIVCEQVLKQNNSYDALDKIHRLIRTGPTGTNVNDISVILYSVQPEEPVNL